MKKIIMYESGEAAVFEERTLRGWWSVKSQHHNGSVFWDGNEHMARYDGCTHKLCSDCGKNIHEKHYTCCHECGERITRERYEKLEDVEWDESVPVCDIHGYNYFNDLDEVSDFCFNNDCEPESLMLVLCEPVYLSQVRDDYWSDDLPEDGEIPSHVIEAIEELNRVLSECGPISWTPGKKKVTINI